MVSPERKRQAVSHLKGHCQASERRACRVTGQARGTQRYRGRWQEKDAPLVAALRRISRARPRAGYRMAAAHLRREGWEVNAKRVQRLWRQEGLKVAPPPAQAAAARPQRQRGQPSERDALEPGLEL